MIIERPGAKNDRELVLSNIDNDRWGRDLPKFRENYDLWSKCKHNSRNYQKVCNSCGHEEKIDKS